MGSKPLNAKKWLLLYLAAVKDLFSGVFFFPRLFGTVLYTVVLYCTMTEGKATHQGSQPTPTHYGTSYVRKVCGHVPAGKAGYRKCPGTRLPAAAAEAKAGAAADAEAKELFSSRTVAVADAKGDESPTTKATAAAMEDDVSIIWVSEEDDVSIIREDYAQGSQPTDNSDAGHKERPRRRRVLEKGFPFGLLNCPHSNDEASSKILTTALLAFQDDIEALPDAAFQELMAALQTMGYDTTSAETQLTLQTHSIEEQMFLIGLVRSLRAQNNCTNQKRAHSESLHPDAPKKKTRKRLARDRRTTFKYRR